MREFPKKHLSIGICLLAVMLVCVLGLFLLCRFLSDQRCGLLEYEAESCTQELATARQDYWARLEGCSGLAGALWIVGQKDYDIQNHNCLNYSQELQGRLKELGIESSIVKGKWGDSSHYWVVIWVEPTEGSFIKSDEDYVLEGIIE